MATKNFYSALGVSKDASKKDIRQAYRRLARQYHPDVNPGDKAGEARFKEINAAYEVLSDTKKRGQYDRYGDQWEHADQIEEMQKRAGGRAFQFGQGGGGVSFDLGDLGGAGGDLGSMFENLFRGGAARRPRQNRKGRDVEQPIEVTLEEAFHGASRTLEFASEGTCSTCGGARELAGATCHVCEGKGTVRKTRRLEVKIPPGVDNGSRVRIKGEGQPGAGRRSGDLMLVVSVRDDERFERKGSDLYVDVEASIADVVLGTEVEVPTMTGKVMLTVPEVTQNQKPFRLSNLGMPKLKGKGRGNLYARLKIKLPEKLDDDERKLFEELREAGL